MTYWVKNLLKKLKSSDFVAVPTDKTNSIKLVEIDKYIKWVEDHMRENTKENYGDFLLCKTANCWLKLVVLSRRGMEMKIHYLSSSGKRLNWPLTVIPSNLP